MSERIAVIGLGYVGLPLARALVASGAHVLGYDVCGWARARTHRAGVPVTGNPDALEGSSVFILCVPTPAKDRHPDLGSIECAARAIAPHVGSGSLVIVESTVQIGGTAHVRRVLEDAGARDFCMAFAPERVSPGDRDFGGYTKVIAAEPEALPRVEALYARLFDELHVAPSIEVAEAAKLLENAQRDINIALVNEAAMICDDHGISIHDVLDAASTKWNFARYSPGLVGGHCIAVDPWYLLASSSGFGERSVIAAARARNDEMAAYVAAQIQGVAAPCQRVLLLGASFKPEVEDTRNSGALAVAEILRLRRVEVDVYDPIAGPTAEPRGLYDVVALLVPHESILAEIGRWRGLVRPGGVLFDPWRSCSGGETPASLSEAC